MSEKKQQGGAIWMLSTFALICVLIGLGISSLNGSPDESATPTPSGVQDSEQSAYVAPGIDDDAMLGDENAPVTMILFSDYQCPYCQSFETETMPFIIEDFVDTGLVRVVFRDYPLSSHEYAHVAAEAAECVGDDDDLYWAYHDLLVANAEEWESYDGDHFDLFSQYAANLGVDQDAYYECLSSGSYYDEVDSDAEDGWASGVRGTPTVFVNGEMVVGALPYEDYVTSDGVTHEGYESIITRVLEATK